VIRTISPPQVYTRGSLIVVGHPSCDGLKSISTTSSKLLSGATDAGRQELGLGEHGLEETSGAWHVIRERARYPVTVTAAHRRPWQAHPGNGSAPPPARARMACSAPAQ